MWLVGANDMLNGAIRWPSEWRVDAHPSVGWEWSHCLRPELATSDESGAPPVDAFLDKSSREQVLAATHHHFTEDVYLDWLESIASVPYLEAELGSIPSTFEALHVQRGAA